MNKKQKSIPLDPTTAATKRIAHALPFLAEASIRRIVSGAGLFGQVYENVLLHPQQRRNTMDSYEWEKR